MSANKINIPVDMDLDVLMKNIIDIWIYDNKSLANYDLRMNDKELDLKKILHDHIANNYKKIFINIDGIITLTQIITNKKLIFELELIGKYFGILYSIYGVEVLKEFKFSPFFYYRIFIGNFAEMNNTILMHILNLMIVDDRFAAIFTTNEAKEFAKVVSDSIKNNLIYNGGAIYDKLHENDEAYEHGILPVDVYKLIENNTTENKNTIELLNGFKIFRKKLELYNLNNEALIMVKLNFDLTNNNVKTIDFSTKESILENKAYLGL
jgi:hypothetical protein